MPLSRINNLQQSTENDFDEPFKCHCGDWRFNNAHFEVDEIREKVCRDLPIYGEIDEKKYCVLHFPSKNKVEDFDLIFQERLEEEFWDFRMVYFPKLLTYESKEFDKIANFQHAAFAEGVSFKYCKFNESVDFYDSVFLDDAYFTYSDFYSQVNFNAADFREYGHFAGVTFYPKSYPSFVQTKFKNGMFGEVKFDQSDLLTKVDFSKAVFLEGVDFSRSEFLLKTEFKDTVFPKSGKTDFEAVKFYKSVSFENVEFFDADFREARFCYEDKFHEKTVFKYCKFDKSVAFTGAEFFQQTDFSKATFQNAHFEETVFSGTTNFRETQFLEDVFFNNSKFGYKDKQRITTGQVNFNGAAFGTNSRVFFEGAWFSWHTNFNYVKFDGYVFFKGTSANPVFDTVFESHAFWGLPDFTYTTIDKPEKVYFQTMRLRASWFVNSVFDLRKVNLSDIDWGNGEGKFFTVKEELEILEKRVRHNSKKLLAITFRQIADNAETNNRFDEASAFRRMALETERLKRKAAQEKWWSEEFTFPEFLFNFWEKLKKAPFDLAYYFYRITSFYGESSSRAFLWLLGIVIVFAFLFCLPVSQFLDKGNFRSLGFIEAVFYSLRMMVLQRPEPPPENLFAKGVVALESVLAPLQAALLALAIRRKFMR